MKLLDANIFDANIFIYAIGRPHPHKEPCRQIVDQLRTQSSEYAIDAEVLQEILNVYSNRGLVSVGVDYVDRLLGLFSEIIPIGRSEIGRAARILQHSSEISARDAIHAAVALEHGLEGIVSYDRGFDRVPGLRRFEPPG